MKSFGHKEAMVSGRNTGVLPREKCLKKIIAQALGTKRGGSLKLETEEKRKPFQSKKNNNNNNKKQSSMH